MTPDELAQECKRVIENEYGMNMLCLVIPGPPPRGQKVRLDRTSRRKCPMGDIANWMNDPPRVVAYFNAVDVLAWLVARGLVTVDAHISPRGQL